MKLDPKLSFAKDIKRLKSKKLKDQLIEMLELLEQIDQLPDYPYSKNLKKLVGGQNYYRIRLGDYLLGIKLVENQLELVHFRHRKEIYKVFP